MKNNQVSREFVIVMIALGIIACLAAIPVLYLIRIALFFEIMESLSF